MKAALPHYHARMQRVLDHIDRHLDCDLDLDAVSGVAAFSKYHFHWQFTATFGLSVHRYIQLARMKRASHRLAYRDAQSVTDIAMDAGYDAPDAFARAFRQRFGQSPSSFRKAPDWEPWLAAFGPLDNAKSKLMQTTYTPDDVTIRDVAPTPVAIMEHRGDPATIGATIQRFIAWRKATGLSPKTSPTFNVFHSDPRTTPPAEYRKRAGFVRNEQLAALNPVEAIVCQGSGLQSNLLQVLKAARIPTHAFRIDGQAPAPVATRRAAFG